MHLENLANEHCDVGSKFKAIDKETQTKQVKDTKCSEKNFKLPLPRELEKKDDEEGTLKVFSFCQIIQDPEKPTSVTIVKESLTEEAHPRKNHLNEDTSSNKYRYCKEVIKPYLQPYAPDCPNSAQLLVNDAIKAAKDEFPENPPCYEVPSPDKKDSKDPKQKSTTNGQRPPPKECSNNCCSDLDESDPCAQEDSCDAEPPPAAPKKCCDCKKDKDKKKERNSDSGPKPNFRLCPGQPQPKICVEITDPSLCPGCPKAKDGKKAEDKCCCECLIGKEDQSNNSDWPAGIESDCCDKSGSDDSCITKLLNKVKTISETCLKKVKPSDGNQPCCCGKPPSPPPPPAAPSSCCCKPKASPPPPPPPPAAPSSCCCKPKPSPPPPPPAPAAPSSCCCKQKSSPPKSKPCPPKPCPPKPCPPKPEAKQCPPPSPCPPEPKPRPPKQCPPPKKKCPPEPKQCPPPSPCPPEPKPCAPKPCPAKKLASSSSSSCPPPKKSSSSCSPKTCPAKKSSATSSCPPPEPKPCSVDTCPAKKSSASSSCPPKEPKPCSPNTCPAKKSSATSSCPPAEPKPCSPNTCPNKKSSTSSSGPKQCSPQPCPAKQCPPQPCPRPCPPEPSSQKQCPVGQCPAHQCPVEECPAKQSASRPCPPTPCSTKISGMDDKPSENPPSKYKPCPTEIPTDGSAKESISDKKVPQKCSKTDSENKTSPNDTPKKNNDTSSDLKFSPKGPCSDGIASQLVQVENAKDCNKPRVTNAGGACCSCGKDDKSKRKTTSKKPANCKPKGSSSMFGKETMDAHSITINTLKCAMKDLMCTVFRTTQDAVSVISTESSKQFEKLKKSASNAFSSSDCPPPKKVSDEPGNATSNTNLRRFSVINLNNLPEQINLPPCKPPEPHPSTASGYLGAALEKVNSAASMISRSLIFEIPPQIKRSYNDDSSEYDVPKPTKPRDVENIIINPLEVNVFTTIKDKIWSMFGDDDKQEREIRSTSSYSESLSSESDEDLINKIID
ncbi:hypothetical protein SFRURICE_017152 [Spodoptera frugiperda]|uniref:SFRICE_000301 n=1 Tax=Spodoptera frugiperda TaxID=7108 RepID=A0A2H1V5U5_SPOFR|nr:hypothetical protein SFRURICE_017152 [Spodoptera frugiperda]